MLGPDVTVAGEDLPFFLALAERFRHFGEGYIPPHQRRSTPKPLLTPELCWRIRPPGDDWLPAVGVVVNDKGQCYLEPARTQ